MTPVQSDLRPIGSEFQTEVISRFHAKAKTVFLTVQGSSGKTAFFVYQTQIQML